MLDLLAGTLRASTGKHGWLRTHYAHMGASQMRRTVWYRGTGTLDSGQNGKVTMVSHHGAIRQMAGVSRALDRSQLPNTGQTLLLGTSGAWAGWNGMGQGSQSTWPAGKGDTQTGRVCEPGTASG